jgi:hypothetical protein
MPTFPVDRSNWPKGSPTERHFRVRRIVDADPEGPVSENRVHISLPWPFRSLMRTFGSARCVKRHVAKHKRDPADGPFLWK